MRTLYLVIEQPWVGEVTGSPDVRNRLLAAVDNGHIRVTSDDTTSDPDSPIRSLVAKVQARFGQGTYDRLRKGVPATPEVAWFDADTNTITWA